jgi:hypothetical protein
MTEPAISPKRRYRIRLLVCLAISAAVILAIYLARTAWTTLRKSLRAEHLYQINYAIDRYSSAHGGQYPDSFSSLLETGLVRPELLASEDNGDTPAGGATTREAVAELNRPGHLSCVYLGSGLTDATAAADVVIAYEIPSTRTDQTSIVLMGGGDVEWLDRSQTAALLRVVSATTRPVRFGIPPRSDP